ncbi:hypothetical protein OG819_54970 [Streptomyces sp. NBC_01549]|uniref:hypothetical protein n=1 Tax=Streptomyces sp. NBC_01549 TaxID=2975874 RepID=UPI0022526E0E|nr:hypothetical protein [Streptomyces sp. NBC_01549]MCX4598262.1 hypothetical protein [Streptomyces sp. NBC_01549]
MLQAPGEVRTDETAIDGGWPARARDVSHIGGACVVQGIGDFDVADLNTVRHRFPGRHVTLDGDVITVWPQARQQE